ncbi:Gfo/Idh/MocA family oxidoreductase [Frankia sp. Mgl5]|uniref:Gfo/Idh/MocA family protein n=1 Tax=Frankia sp. Mgl5 TaxID=2933793 RepID=UPI00200D64DF|nr:Gfo/Idh/MocA family oxidoreductase [Frankia sp. Mgl5]MCK9929749.1 Gfo/Idh/MocA family oxidoreductase [Frankia sp. Mgl5]
MVGLGWAARSIWLPRLLSHPAFEIVAATDPHPESRAAAVRAFPGIALLPDLDGLAGTGVDLAVVAVPNNLHTPVAAGLLERGMPVFLEKPVCLTSAEADQLAAAEKAGGAVLLAGSAARYRGDMLTLGRVATGLGEIRHVELAWIRARGIPAGSGWFTDRRRSGGGALIDLGWHLLDTVGPLVGAASYEQVVGTVSNDFLRAGTWDAAWRGDKTRPAWGDVEDTARGFLVGTGGVSVALHASWASHHALDTTLIVLEGSAGRAELRCTFGFSPNRQQDSVLSVTRAGVTTIVPTPEESVGAEYDRQLDQLAGALRDPASRGLAITEARVTIEVIERFYASARRAAGAISSTTISPVPAVNAGL